MCVSPETVSILLLVITNYIVHRPEIASDTFDTKCVLVLRLFFMTLLYLQTT